MKLWSDAMAKKAKLPKLYATDGNSDKVAVAKFFSIFSNWTWYVVEGEKQENGDWLFFGLVEGQEKELGYFTLSQLTDVKRGKLPIIERDLYFEPTHLNEL